MLKFTKYGGRKSCPASLNPGDNHNHPDVNPNPIPLPMVPVREGPVPKPASANVEHYRYDEVDSGGGARGYCGAPGAELEIGSQSDYSSLSSSTSSSSEHDPNLTFNKDPEGPEVTAITESDLFQLNRMNNDGDEDIVPGSGIGSCFKRMATSIKKPELKQCLSLPPRSSPPVPPPKPSKSSKLWMLQRHHSLQFSAKSLPSALKMSKVTQEELVRLDTEINTDQNRKLTASNPPQKTNTLKKKRSSNNGHSHGGTLKTCLPFSSSSSKGSGEDLTDGNLNFQEPFEVTVPVYEDGYFPKVQPLNRFFAAKGKNPKN